MSYEEILERFKDQLRISNLKVTRERVIILEEVLKRTDHFDADQFAADLNVSGIKVSRATVYRTLDILNDMKIVHKSTLGHKHQHYECMVNRAHHDHLVCLKCDKVVEFLEPEIEELQEKVCRDHGFVIKDHSLQLFGICAECIDAEKQDNN